MPRQSEPSANNALGRLLQRMLPTCSVRTENTQAIAGHPGLRPDILITAAGRSPVVIEAEFVPGANVEVEARDRLGLRTTTDGRHIEAVIGLRYPASLTDVEDLNSALENSRLSFFVFTQEGDGRTRFPTLGWLDGSVEDLADFVRLTSAPQYAVNRATDIMEEGIDRAEGVLDEVAKLRPASANAVAKLLGMTNAPHSRRMACAIIANALIFHERLAGIHEGVRPLDLVGNSSGGLKRGVIEAWSEILRINYWPIFAIARDLVGQLESWDAVRILRTLRGVATEIRATGVDNSHDLTGRVFQRLIADRKYLATFYTLPASASLLARLAVEKMDSVDWSDAGAIGRLRIADFACGTGALLSAVYEQVSARHERTGGDGSALHSVMMEDVLYGCDVMPSAIHITGSTLAGIQPGGKFKNSRLYTLAYGRQMDGSVAIGSLDLLRASQTFTLFNTSDPAQRTGSSGEETAFQVVADIPEQSFDLVIMNPPFTSNTKHYGSSDGIVNAAFAAFDASKEDQDAMASRLRQKAKNTAYHGHAGLSSAFASLGHRKLKPGGVLGLVLPFTVVNGASWAKFRRLIAEEYTDLTVLSIVAEESDQLSFSADTNIAECLVIARKKHRDESAFRMDARTAVDGRLRGRFASLRQRPRGLADASSVARNLQRDSGRRLEDGPFGGDTLFVGREIAGELLDAPADDYKNGWGAARILDAAVAQVAYSLSRGRLWLPAAAQSIKLQTVRLSDVGRLGVHDSMLTMKTHRGPFTKEPPSGTSTFPSLYNHDAKRETHLICEPDSQLRVRQGMEARAAYLWTTSSRAHLNRDFRLNSQPLAVAFTERRSIGGTVWPNVTFKDQRFDQAFIAWGNSTLGLLAYWWNSSRQHNGRGRMTRQLAPFLVVLDFRKLTDSQLATAEVIVEEFRDKDLQPAYLADVDPNRALLDRYVLCDLLGFDEDIYKGVRRLAAKWCAEPSVHGGKQRPANAELAL